MSASLRILDETRIDIDEALRRLGTEENPIHFTTFYRLTKRGLKAPDGARKTLEHLRVGGRLITSVEAIERFVAATNGIDLGGESAAASPVRTKRRQRELDRVDAELAAAGI
jgi:hypothetical protein